MNVQSIFYLAAIGIALFVIARYYKDYPTGILSGMWLFLLGIMIIISPVTDLTVFQRNVIGVLLFGFGGYVFIRGSIEQFKELDV